MMDSFLAAGMHWKLINFILFVGLLIHFLKKPVAEFWQKRSEHLRNDVVSSQNNRRTIQEKFEALEKRYGRIEQEVSELIRVLGQEGEQEKEYLMQEATKLSRKMIEDASRMVEQETKRAREILKIQTTQLAIELAERMVRESFTSSDQQKLSQKYLTELAELEVA